MTKLIDKYYRNINYLRISVTDRCNLRCVYCMPESGVAYKSNKEILTYEEILKIARAGAQLGISRVRITGGEPLVRKDITFLIKELIKIKELKDVGLTTNGLLLREYIDELKTAGLRRINISLDTLDREKYKLITRSDCLDRILEGIDESIRKGFEPVKINMVVMKGINENEIENFAVTTFSKPLHIRFIEFMPVGICSFRSEDRFIPNDEIKSKLKNLGALIEEDESITGNKYSSYRLKGAKGTISFISPISKPFCSSCSRLRLTSDGKLRLCLSSSDSLDLMPLLRGSKFNSEDLVDTIIKGVGLKPKSHHFNRNEYVPAQMAMCQIGG